MLIMISMLSMDGNQESLKIQLIVEAKSLLHEQWRDVVQSELSGVLLFWRLLRDSDPFLSYVIARCCCLFLAGMEQLRMLCIVEPCR